jgi:hypothetical protein
MTTATNRTKRVSRSPQAATRRRAGASLMSDRRYFVQCAYRVTMALITLTAVLIVRFGG